MAKNQNGETISAERQADPNKFEVDRLRGVVRDLEKKNADNEEVIRKLRGELSETKEELKREKKHVNVLMLGFEHSLCGPMMFPRRMF